MDDVFVPNGLLGSNTLKLDDFTPNGLLGGVPTKSSEQEATPLVPDPFKPIFVANGLLGSVATPKDVERTETIRGLSEPELAASSTEDTFVPNGLLGSSAPPTFAPTGLLSDAPALARDMFTPTGLLSEPGPSKPVLSASLQALMDDNEELPPLPDLGVPNGPALVSYVPRMAIRATTYDGKMIHIKRKKRTGGLVDNVAGPSANKAKGLLDVPIHRMLDSLSLETAQKLSRLDTEAASGSAPTTIEDTLWVDRYRPQKFTELMGNERASRETMAWVKQWDWCVFGKKKGKKRARDDEEDPLFDPEDPYHRPRDKLLLISGPAGLGKTTLAHVVAKQAGYEVMEINASDARSGQIIDDRIQPALESGSAVGSTKPILVIIDEIDGATGGDNSSTFIHKLVQLTLDKPRKKGRAGQGRDPKEKRPLLRPIICICNDQNAASLAKLRPHAYQIRFARPSDIHTVKRLREVCELEGMTHDSRALATLVGVAKGDLRGCLNTLQFIKARNQEVTEAVIRGATVGMKGADTTITSVLNSLFAPMSRKRVKELGLGEEAESKFVNRLSREVEGSGRESGVAVGCFSHYTNLRQHDATFTRHEKAIEWLLAFDQLSGAMYKEADFGLSGYLSYMLVPFYSLFQERGGQKIEKSLTDWEASQLTRANEEVYKSLMRGLRTASKQGGDFRHLVTSPIMELEFAPYINRIISPPIKPVNSQVIQPKERALLTRLVSIMASLELRFVQEKGEDGQFTYRLDPPVDVFVTYDGKRAGDIAVSRYAVRHMVAQEVDAELISRQVDAVEKGNTSKIEYFSRPGNKKFSGKDVPTTQNGTPAKASASAQDPNKRARVDNSDIADKPAVDFFGRLVTVKSASDNRAAERKNVEKKYRVTYRFAEGNSAAVRKPVKVGTFL